MIVKAKESFHCVFGADSFIHNWPHIETSGVLVRKIRGYYYVVNTAGVTYNDTAFFSQEELDNHLEIL